VSSVHGQETAGTFPVVEEEVTMNTVMKTLVTAAALAFAMSATASNEPRQPAKSDKAVKLTKSEMASITAGKPPGSVNGLVQSNKNGTPTNNGPPPYPNK